MEKSLSIISIEDSEILESYDLKLKDGIFTVENRSFSPKKAVCSVAIFGVVIVGSSLASTAIMLAWLFIGAIILHVACVIIYCKFSEKLKERMIQGKTFSDSLWKTHNLTYELSILISHWENCSIEDNVFTCFGKSLRRYGDQIKGVVHCPWEQFPFPIIEDKDSLKRAFEEFKVRYRMPKLTGKLLQLKYAGQESKNKRFDAPKGSI